MKNLKWQQAMNTKIKNFEVNKTWTLTTLSLEKKPRGCTWMYRTKYKTNGNIEKYKDHLVAKGYN